MPRSLELPKEIVAGVNPSTTEPESSESYSDDMDTVEVEDADAEPASRTEDVDEADEAPLIDEDELNTIVKTASIQGGPLTRAARAPLLSDAEKIELGKAIEAGVFAAEKLNVVAGELDERDQQDLTRLVALGDAAKDRLLRSNTRLVISIANNPKYESRGASLNDRIQMGYLGLIRAMQKWDHTRGIQFGTYATYWIRQSISRELADTGTDVRVPRNTGELVRKVAYARNQFWRENGYYPDTNFLASTLDLSEKRVKELLQIDRLQPTSYNRPVDDRDDADLDSLIEDGDILDPEAHTVLHALAGKLHHDLAKVGELKERYNINYQKDIGLLVLRYGLIVEDPSLLPIIDGAPFHVDRPYTTEEIGAMIGMGEGGVRTRLSKARRRIKPLLSELGWSAGLFDI